MANHKTIADDEEFSTILASSPNKLIVVDFSATWCAPCQKIAPIFIQLSHKFPNALFLGVDVDRCRETAMQQGVSAMPTFIFYKNRTRIDMLRGPDANALEEKIRTLYNQMEASLGGDLASSGGSSGGFPDIYQYFDAKQCECLNESDDTPFQLFLEGKSKLLSDCDEQLILAYGFNQNVKIQSFKIKSSGDNGPKSLKFFINQPKTLDFDSAAGMTPVQEIELTAEDLTGETPVQLKYVKFQSVHNLQIFVAGNQNGDEVTQIDSITFYGQAMNTTNMGEFKRVSGDKGESH